MPRLPLLLRRIKYEESAEAYLRSLPLEHFMEATPQATQRKITLESLDLVHARRPEVQIFNELLIQYPLDDEDNGIGKVVPDNMVVIWKEPIEAEGSYDLPFQPAVPFWTLEYVSKNTKRKDYEASFHKYEQELKIPYYLMFVPEAQEMNLFHLRKERYVSVRANREGRFAIRKLDLEIGLLDGWVRYWYQGELLPLPADLMHDLEQARQQLAKAKRRASRAVRRAEQADRRAEQADRRANEAERRAEEERQQRLAMEEELARLRALEQRQNRDE